MSEASKYPSCLFMRHFKKTTIWIITGQIPLFRSRCSCFRWTASFTILYRNISFSRWFDQFKLHSAISLINFFRFLQIFFLSRFWNTQENHGRFLLLILSVQFFCMLCAPLLYGAHNSLLHCDWCTMYHFLNLFHHSQIVVNCSTHYIREINGNINFQQWRCERTSAN